MECSQRKLVHPWGSLQTPDQIFALISSEPTASALSVKELKTLLKWQQSQPLGENAQEECASQKL